MTCGVARRCTTRATVQLGSRHACALHIWWRLGRTQECQLCGSCRHPPGRLGGPMLKGPRSGPGFAIAQAIGDAARPKPHPSRPFTGRAPSLRGARGDLIPQRKISLCEIRRLAHVSPFRLARHQRQAPRCGGIFPVFAGQIRQYADLWRRRLAALDPHIKPALSALRARGGPSIRRGRG
jgi:hypothetical protein